MQNVTQPRDLFKAVLRLGVSKAQLPSDIGAGGKDVANIVKGKCVTLTAGYGNDLFAC